MKLHFVTDYLNPGDKERQLKLGKDLERVRQALFDAKCHRVSDLAKELQIPECSVSSLIRALRKPKYGAYDIELVKLGKTGSCYRLVNI